MKTDLWPEKSLESDLENYFENFLEENIGNIFYIDFFGNDLENDENGFNDGFFWNDLENSIESENDLQNVLDNKIIRMASRMIF